MNTPRCDILGYSRLRAFTAEIPNTKCKHILASRPNLSQHPKVETWKIINFFGIVLQYHRKCMMVLQQYDKSNINILFLLFSPISHLSLSFSVSHSLSSLSPSSLSHFLKYYMVLGITHQRFVAIIWTTIITNFSITIILIYIIAWPISPNIKAINPSNILIDRTHLLRENNNILRRKGLGIHTQYIYWQF